MARRSGRAHMAWVRSFKKNSRRKRRNPVASLNPRRRRRSTRRRRNSYPMAGVALNPRRRRSYRRRRNPVVNARHRRRGRRNPSVTRLLGVEMPPLQAVLWAGVGFVAPSSIETWLNTNIIPVSLSGNTIGKYAVRIGSVLGLSWIVKQVMGSSEAKMVGIGGGAYVLISALKEFAPGVIPGVGAYVLPGSRGMSAYVQPTRQLSAGGVPVFGASKTNVARFNRFA